MGTYSCWDGFFDTHRFHLFYVHRFIGMPSMSSNVSASPVSPTFHLSIINPVLCPPVPKVTLDYWTLDMTMDRFFSSVYGSSCSPMAQLNVVNPLHCGTEDEHGRKRCPEK